MKILHVIDNMKQGGGAETLVAGTIEKLKEHENHLLNFTGHFDFENELAQCSKHTVNFDSKWKVIQKVVQTREIIKSIKPDIIHSHLPFATNIVRLAKPNDIPLIFSVHTTLSTVLFKKSPIIYLFEKIFYNSDQSAVFVTEAVRNDYKNIRSIRGPAYFLPNYINPLFFLQQNRKEELSLPLKKFISVGSLKAQKNHETLIKAFAKLKNKDFKLDIYGEGPLRDSLQAKISALDAQNVHLKGNHSNIEKILKNYDGYILASKFEGFGIAPIEAAAVGLPLFLSDIKVFQEVTDRNALFFSPENEKEIVDLLLNQENNKKKILYNKNKMHEICDNYKIENYMKKLRAIYKYASQN